MLERGYLWIAPWRDDPRMLFEQYLGFLVLSQAYKIIRKTNKQSETDQNRWMLCYEAKERKKILCSPSPSMFNGNLCGEK